MCGPAVDEASDFGRVVTVVIAVGTFIDRKHVINTLLQQNALTQAVGFRRPENPPFSTPSSILVLLLRHSVLRLFVVLHWLVLHPWVPWGEPVGRSPLSSPPFVSVGRSERCVRTVGSKNIVLPFVVCALPVVVGTLLVV